MSRETIISEGRTYARKKPGESFRAYACAFCSRLISWTTVQQKSSPKRFFIGVHCKACGHALPRRVCRAFVKERQRKRRGWRKG